ncbi:hypothetical protein FQN50_002761 [Emmonsiellopsis sp. PD_5]|nr:hypothetical protein FQN50_002761 [Emmonsiellopsis sp. PD_5]
MVPRSRPVGPDGKESWSKSNASPALDAIFSDSGYESGPNSNPSEDEDSSDDSDNDALDDEAPRTLPSPSREPGCLSASTERDLAGASGNGGTGSSRIQQD